MRTLKLWLASALLYLSRKFHEWGNRLARMVSRLQGVEEIAQEDGLPPDDQLFFLMKRSNGRYEMHGIVAQNWEDARKQAWHIPGSLILLDSMDEFRTKLLSEAERRRRG